MRCKRNCFPTRPASRSPRIRRFRFGHKGHCSRPGLLPRIENETWLRVFDPEVLYRGREVAHIADITERCPGFVHDDNGITGDSSLDDCYYRNYGIPAHSHRFTISPSSMGKIERFDLRILHVLVRDLSVVAHLFRLQFFTSFNTSRRRPCCPITDDRPMRMRRSAGRNPANPVSKTIKEIPQ